MTTPKLPNLPIHPQPNMMKPLQWASVSTPKTLTPSPRTTVQKDKIPAMQLAVATCPPKTWPAQCLTMAQCPELLQLRSWWRNVSCRIRPVICHTRVIVSKSLGKQSSLPIVILGPIRGFLVVVPPLLIVIICDVVLLETICSRSVFFFVYLGKCRMCILLMCDCF